MGLPAQPFAFLYKINRPEWKQQINRPFRPFMPFMPFMPIYAVYAAFAYQLRIIIIMASPGIQLSKACSKPTQSNSKSASTKGSCHYPRYPEPACRQAGVQ
jgi:hypothetical protein